MSLYLSILQKNFAEKYYKMATLQQFLRGMLNLRRSAARTITGGDLKLGERKKNLFCGIGECLNKVVNFHQKKDSHLLINIVQIN